MKSNRDTPASWVRYCSTARGHHMQRGSKDCHQQSLTLSYGKRWMAGFLRPWHSLMRGLQFGLYHTCSTSWASQPEATHHTAASFYPHVCSYMLTKCCRALLQICVNLPRAIEKKLLSISMWGKAIWILAFVSLQLQRNRADFQHEMKNKLVCTAL